MTVPEGVSAITTEANVTAITEIGMSLFNLVVKLVGDAVALVTANWLWGIVIVIAVKALDFYVLDRVIPLPVGYIRYGISFIIVMFFSFLFVPILDPVIAGFLNG